MITKRKVACVDAFYVKGKVSLLIANDDRHNELWRRSDPGLDERSLAAFRSKRSKVQVFEHNTR